MPLPETEAMAQPGAEPEFAQPFPGGEQVSTSSVDPMPGDLPPEFAGPARAITAVTVMRDGVEVRLAPGTLLAKHDQVVPSEGGVVEIAGGVRIDLGNAKDFGDLLTSLATGQNIDAQLLAVLKPEMLLAEKLGAEKELLEGGEQAFQEALLKALNSGLSFEQAYASAQMAYWQVVNAGLFLASHESTSTELLVSLATGKNVDTPLQKLLAANGGDANESQFEDILSDALTTGANLERAITLASSMIANIAALQQAAARDPMAQLVNALASGQNVSEALAANGGDSQDFADALSKALSSGNGFSAALASATSTAQQIARSIEAAANNPAVQLINALASGQNAANVLNAAGANAGDPAAFEQALSKALGSGAPVSQAVATAAQVTNQITAAVAAAQNNPAVQLATALASGQNASAALAAAGGSSGGANFEQALSQALAGGSSIAQATSTAQTVSSQVTAAVAAAANNPSVQLLAALSSGNNAGQALAAAGGAAGGAGFEQALGNVLGNGTGLGQAVAAASQTASSTQQAAQQAANNPAAEVALALASGTNVSAIPNSVSNNGSGAGSVDVAALAAPLATNTVPQTSQTAPVATATTTGKETSSPPAAVSPSATGETTTPVNGNTVPATQGAAAPAFQTGQSVTSKATANSASPASPPAASVATTSANTSATPAASESALPPGQTSQSPTSASQTSPNIAATTTANSSASTAAQGSASPTGQTGQSTTTANTGNAPSQQTSTSGFQPPVFSQVTTSLTSIQRPTLPSVVQPTRSASPTTPSSSSETPETVSSVPVNRAPVNGTLTSYQTAEDQRLFLTGLSVSDPDAGNLKIVSTISVQHGKLSLLTPAQIASGDGTASVVMTGTVAEINALLKNGNLSYLPDSNYFGSDTLTIVTDDRGNTGAGGKLVDTDIVPITIISVNDAAVLSSAVIALAEGQSIAEVSAAGSLSITDLDSPEVYISQVNTAGRYGRFSIDTNGQWTYSASDAHDQFTAGSIHVDRFAVTSADGTETFVEIVITGTNDAPVITSFAGASDVAINKDENIGAVTNVAAGDVDFTGLSYAISGGADARLFNIDAATGSLSFIDAPNFERPVDADRDNIYEVSVTVTDGDLTDIQNFAITINDVNEAPEFTSYQGAATASIAINENTTAVATGTAGDADGDALVFSLSGGDDQLLFDIDPTTGELTFRNSADYENPRDADGDNVYDVLVEVTDGQLVDNQHFAITINDINEAPVAVGDNYTTDEDTALTVAANGVLANDGDVDGDALTVELVTDVAHGSLTLNADGSFTYLADANYNGNDSFSYKVNDGSLDSNTVTVALTVVAVNDVPVAIADAYQTNEDTTLTLSAANGLLANDSDVEGSSLSVSLVSGTSHGVLNLNRDGSFTFAPDANFNGTDSFSYKVNDGTADGNMVTVNLTVSAVNDAPVATGESYTTDEDTALTIAANGVLANDGDVDGDALTIELVTDVAHGSLTLNADGSFTYLADANYNGNDSFSYKVNDGSLDSNTVTVALTVVAVNDVPVAIADAYQTNEDQSLNVSAANGLLANDSDVEGSLLSVALVSNTSHGVLNLNTDGSFTYAPDANFNGTDSFSYKVNDGTAHGNTVTVNLTVSAVNDAPVATGESYTTDEDTALIVAANGVLANDTDVERDPLTAVLVSNVAHGTLALAANGSFVYTPQANYNGTDSFTYRANDGRVNGNTVTVNLTVNAANDAPVGRSDAYSVNEDTTLTVNTATGVRANDSDVEGSTLTTTLISSVSHGSLTLNGDGSFSYIPEANYYGTDSFTYKVNDGTVDGNVSTVTLTVNAVNDAPVLTGTAATLGSTSEDTSFVVSKVALLQGWSDVDGDVLSVGNLTADNGTVSAPDANGSYVVTPNANYSGNLTLSYSVKDSNMATGGLVAFYRFDNAANLGYDSSGNNNHLVSYGTTAYTANGYDGGGLSLTGNGYLSTLNKMVPIGTPTGSQSYTLSAWFKNPGVSGTDGIIGFGNYGSVRQVNAVRLDGSGLFNYWWAVDLRAGGTASGTALNNNSFHNVTVTYNGSERIIYIDGLRVASDNPGTPNIGSGNFAIGATNSYQELFRGVLDNVAIYQGALTASQVGGLTVAGSSVGYTLSVAVQAVDDVPVAVADSFIVAEDGTLSINASGGLLSNDIERDGETLRATLVTSTQHGSLTLLSNGEFTYTPAADYFGQDSFSYSANDGITDSNVVTVSLTVQPVNDAPIAVAESYSVLEDGSLVVDAASGVLANDSDNEGSALSAVLVTSVAHGTLVLNANGSFTYSPTSNYSGSDSFTYKVRDGSADGNTVTVNLSVGAVNDAPTVMAQPTSLVDFEGIISGDYTNFNNGTSFGGLNWSNNSGFVQIISGNFFYGNQLYWSMNGTTVLSTPYPYSDNVLTVTKSGNAFAVQEFEVKAPEAAQNLQMIGSFQGQQVFSQTQYLAANTPGKVTLPSGMIDTLTISGSNSRVTVDNLRYIDGSMPRQTFIENGASVVVSPQLSLVDTDNTNLSSATVQITGNLDAANDHLIFTDQNGISGTFDSALGQLTLKGTASVETYQAALRSVRFETQTEAPSVLPRSISFTVSDGTLTGTSSTTVLVTGNNDAPVALDDSLASIPEDSGVRTISIASLLVNDSNGPSDEAAQTLTITGLSNVAGGTAVISGTDILFTPTADYNGAAGFEYTVSDNGTTNGVNDFKTDVGSVSFSVTAVNDAPVAVDDSLTSISEDSGVATISFASLLNNDIAGPANETAQTLTITAVSNATGGTAVISGTDILFTPTANYSGAAGFDYTVSDNGMTNGVNDFKTDVGRASGTVTPVNDAPTFTGLGGATFLENTVNAAAQIIDSNVTLADIDSSDFNGGSLTVGYSAGGGVQDQLSILNAGNAVGQIGVSGSTVSYGGVPFGTISGGTNGTNLVVTFNTATATPAAVETLIERLAYANTSAEPTASRTVTVTVTDGDDGSVSATSTITVTPQPDAVAVVNPGFEADTVPSTTTGTHSFYVLGAPTGWTITGTGGYTDPAPLGVGATGNPWYAMGSENGTNLVFLQKNSSFSQTLSSTAQAGTYTLTAQYADVANFPGRPEFAVRLYAGSTLLGQQLHPAVSVTDNNVWQTAAITVTIAAGAATIGQALRIELINLAPPTGSEAQILFDNVALTFCVSDPVVLDLNGDGLHFAAANFDMNANGIMESIGLPTGGDGLLVVDLDNSGSIEDGTEVFSPVFNDGNFANSIDALASLDSNTDGKISADDIEFTNIKLWIDGNANGKSDLGELYGLSDRNIVSISLDSEAADFIVEGQTVFAEGTFEMADGTSGRYFGLELGPLSDVNSGSVISSAGVNNLTVEPLPLTAGSTGNLTTVDFDAILAGFTNSDAYSDDLTTPDYDVTDLPAQSDEGAAPVDYFGTIQSPGLEMV